MPALFNLCTPLAVCRCDVTGMSFAFFFSSIHYKITYLPYLHWHKI